MTVKEFLRQYKFLKMQLESLCESAAATFSLLTSCGIDPERERVLGGSGNSQEAALIRYIEFKDKVAEKCAELLKLQEQIEEIIDAVQEPTLAVLLRRRYIDGLTWEEVAEALGYSVRWTIKRLHPDALREAEKFFKNSQ